MAFDLLREYVGEMPREIHLDEDDPEVAFLTATKLSQQAPVRSPDQLPPLLRPPRSAEASSSSSAMLVLLHQTRQDEIGSSLFQVLSELNSELQKCAGAGERLSYDQYCVLRNRVSRRLKRWLTTKIFLMLRDEGGACDIHALSDYFYSVGCMGKTRLPLQSYAAGSLQEKDVERWILDLYPSITMRADFTHNDPEFLAVYTAAATRCFFFFLDPHKVPALSFCLFV